jgi:hypothetical protein
MPEEGADKQLVKVWLMSDCYLGIDQCVPIKLEVA